MRALVFDLDGTLLQYTDPYEEILRSTFKSVSGRSERQWLDTYNERFATEFAACNPTPVQRAFAATSAPGDRVEFAERLIRAETEATEPPPKAHEDLETLSEQYAFAILTNGMSEWQRRKLDAHSLASYFEAVVTSYDVGAHKPTAEPYETVEGLVGAESYAMIGDSDEDVDGAEAAGWQSYRYTGGRIRDLVMSLDWI